jgi:hypothetical protein
LVKFLTITNSSLTHYFSMKSFHNCKRSRVKSSTKQHFNYTSKLTSSSFVPNSTRPTSLVNCMKIPKVMFRFLFYQTQFNITISTNTTLFSLITFPKTSLGSSQMHKINSWLSNSVAGGLFRGSFIQTQTEMFKFTRKSFNFGGSCWGIINKTLIGWIFANGGNPVASSKAVIPVDQISAFGYNWS